MVVTSKARMHQHNRFLKCAEELTHLSDVPRFKYGAVLVHNKAIISSGFNSTKTHPMQHKLNQRRELAKRDRGFLHAEVAALQRIRNVPRDSVLYIVRLSRIGWQMARPCAGCMQLIREKGIKKIIYTTPDGFAEEVLY